MDPERTALVLIGYQNDYFAADGVLSQVIEESSRVTGNLAHTVDLLQRLYPSPILVVATPIVFTPDYRELIEPVGILKTVKELRAFRAETKGAPRAPAAARGSAYVAAGPASRAAPPGLTGPPPGEAQPSVPRAGAGWERADGRCPSVSA